MTVMLARHLGIVSRWYWQVILSKSANTTWNEYSGGVGYSRGSDGQLSIIFSHIHAGDKMGKIVGWMMGGLVLLTGFILLPDDFRQLVFIGAFAWLGGFMIGTQRGFAEGQKLLLSRAERAEERRQIADQTPIVVNQPTMDRV